MNKGKIMKAKIIQDSEEESDSSLPIIAPKAIKKQQVEDKKVVKKVAKKVEESEEDTPIVEKKPTKQIKTEFAPSKKALPEKKKIAKKESSEEEESEEEKPKKIAPKAKSPLQKPQVSKKMVQESSEQESEEAPKQPLKKIVKSPLQKAAPAPQKIVLKKKAPTSSEEESEEEVKPTKPAAKAQIQKAPLQKAKSPVQKPLAAKKPAQQSSEQQSEEKPAPKKVFGKPAAKVVAKKSSSEEEDSPEPVKPTKKVVQPTQPVKVATKAAKKAPSESEQESEEVKPKAVQKKTVAQIKSPVVKPIASKKKPVQEESDNEEEQPKAPVRKGSKDLKGGKKQAEDESGEFEICVQGLSFNAYDSDVRDLFNECGNITEVKLLTRPDGKSKGLAFVKFSKKSSFTKSLEFNGYEHLGRNIKVEQSLGKKDKPFGNNNGGFNNNNSFSKPAYQKNNYNQGEANIETPTLFIGGLSYNSTVDSIKEFFASAGPVVSARIATDRETGKARGFGYVEFYDVDTAKKAYDSMNGQYLDGRNIRLDSATQRDKPPGGFGGGFGGGRGAPRNTGNSTVILGQDDKNAKKGAMGTFKGKKMTF